MQVMKMVSRQGEAVELEASICSRSEKQLLNPEVQGAEKFWFKLSRRGGSRRHRHCAAMAVGKARRGSHEQAALPPQLGDRSAMRAETQGSNRTEEHLQRMALWFLIICIYA